MTASDHLHPQQFFHGTSEELQPGSELEPTGVTPYGLPKLEHWRAEHVWMTSEPHHAAVWAEGRGGAHVYQVEPAEKPTWHYPTSYDQDIEDEALARDQYYAPKARVVRRIHPPTAGSA